MNQKVWVISDRDWDDAPVRQQAVNPPHSGQEGRSPALSYSLSMLVWGGGYLYVGKVRPAAFFMAAMVVFYAALCSLFMFRDALSNWIFGSYFPTSWLLAASVAVFFLFVLTWLSSAVYIYFRTEKSRSEPFRGVDHAIWPLLGSILFPGWGQFLNAQPKKGLIFGLFGLLGCCSCWILAVCWQFWPVLRVNPDMFVVELCLVVAITSVPITGLISIVSIHDAFWTCREPLRKWPFKARLKHVSMRIRKQGAVRVLIEEMRSPTLLALLLAASILAGIQFSPWDDYLDALERMKVELQHNNLEITSALLDRVGNVIKAIIR